MPLHDWRNLNGWEGLHHLWMVEILRWIKPRLPEGYRAYIGSAPVVAVGAPGGKPDVSVQRWDREGANGTDSPKQGGSALEEPDEEIAVAVLDPTKSLFVEHHGRLVAALELIPPRNKDRPAARNTYLARYIGYLLDGVNLLLVDVHPTPMGFSFADQIAEQLQFEQPSVPPPMAVAYRVGEPAATGGRLLGIWRRPFSRSGPRCLRFRSLSRLKPRCRLI